MGCGGSDEGNRLGQNHVCNPPAQVPRSEALAGRGDISVLSWNILAECFFSAGSDDDYSYVKDPATLEWPRRLARIIAELQASSSDIICLQEVEHSTYSNYILPALQAFGYVGVIQSGKSGKARDHPGLATLWKQSGFSLVAQFNRTRSMSCVLAQRSTGPMATPPDNKDSFSASAEASRARGSKSVAVANVHLEGHPLKSDVRVKQLHSTLRELKKNHPHHGLIICGDFNCELRSSACSAYLSFGTVPPGTVDMGGFVVAEGASHIPAHGYKLASVYGGKDGGLSRVPGERFTYIGRPGHPVDAIDQMWATTATLKCMAQRELFHSDEHRVQMLGSGLPGPGNPSDHLPIAVVFDWRHAPEVIGGGQRPDMGGGGGGAGCSGSEALLEAELLLAACPFFSEKQREEFMAISTTVPGLPMNGKPSPEQLAALKELRVRKEKLMAVVSQEVKQMLEHVLRLRKQAKKQAAKAKDARKH